MLTTIHLGNFKAFASPAEIPIRPLTLLFGPNSAGKSSIIHGLALGHEALHRRQFDIVRTELGGDSIDLGGFRQYVHRRALDQRVTWGIEVDLRKSEHRNTNLPRSDRLTVLVTFGLPLDDKGRTTPRGNPLLTSYEVKLGGDVLLRMSLRRNERLQIDALTPVFMDFLRRHGAEAPARRGGQSFDDVDMQEAATRLALPPVGLSPAHPTLIPASAVSVERTTLAEEALSAADMLFPEQTSRPGPLLLSGMAAILRDLRFWLIEVLDRITYLGPLRSYPPRHMAFAAQNDPNWSAGGGQAWDRMRKSKKLRDALNSWLGSKQLLQTPYRITLRRFVAPATAESAIGAGIDEILKHLNARAAGSGDEEDIGDGISPLDRWDRDEFVRVITQKLQSDRAIEGDSDLVLLDMRTNTAVSHRDVGIGISQVLPVLVEAYGNEGRLIAIEQPEIHLHPRLQAEIADVFMESALGERKNTFVLETHSEHLILRIMRRIRETTQSRLPAGMPAVRPKDVAVLSVVPDRDGSRIVEIPITTDGELGGPWPGGFFPERMKELY